jgi:hypothetical protein
LTDLERFFATLVRTVGSQDRTRLQKPLLLVDIRNSILPYRANRRALQLESSEDYEWVLMRLCAGEGGFARTGPDEVRDEFVEELLSPNPDLTLLERRENAVVHLDPRAVAKALVPEPDLAYAPPVTPPPATRPAAASRSKRAARESRPGTSRQGKDPNTGARCGRCGSTLPTGRVVNFCPSCGQSLAPARCASCQTELDPTWRHCVTCGAVLHNA